MSMLEQAIVDAKDLREVAKANAEAEVLEKYSSQALLFKKSPLVYKIIKFLFETRKSLKRLCGGKNVCL